MSVPRGSVESLVEQLASFRLTLSRGGKVAAQGGGELVLGSPVNALAHLVRLLASLPDHPPIEPGEIVTTGTLTGAMPAVAGETWSTRIGGVALTGYRFGLREANPFRDGETFRNAGRTVSMLLDTLQGQA